MRKSKNRFEVRHKFAVQPIQPEVLQQAEAAIARLVAQAYMADHLEHRKSTHKSAEHSSNNSGAGRSL